jgi:hypothetical protein
VSWPHAQQQNGSDEQKYRHIAKLTTSFLANASMPLKYWDTSFLIATFLINVLHKVLNYSTKNFFISNQTMIFFKFLVVRAGLTLRP